MPLEKPPEPWHSFFLDVESALDQLVELHCMGGFVISMLYGMPRPTADVSKLERNAARDREDVKYLARTVPLDLDLLETRYRTELRPYLSSPERHDLTLRLWRDAILGS